MNNTETWTIQRLLNWTSDFFKTSDADQPRLDAEVLLAEALGCQRIELYTRFDQEPTAEQRQIFRDWVKRRAAGEPVAYLVGMREFFSMEFAVTPDVLIPRPETEHLVVEAIDRVKEHFSQVHPVAILDVGTGSGNIAVTLAHHIPQAQLTALDIHPPALDVARQNAVRHGVQDRIRFLRSDLLDALPPGEMFHLIVSNPPYVGLAEKPDLPREVREFEPPQALFSSGQVGDETIARLVKQVGDRLLPGGFLIVEISPQLAPRCNALMQRESERFAEFEIKKDLAGLDRFLVARHRDG